jgi:hypothetical protein
MPLVSYSVLITALYAWALLQPKPPHPLEAVPDVNGVNPPATRRGGKVVRTHEMGRWARLALPPQLRVRLGESLRLGDLKVTPLKAEWRTVWVYTNANPNAEPGEAESLVLWMELENVSADVAFCPLDPMFYRPYTRQFQGGDVPLTCLVRGEGTAGEQQYYGGFAKWDLKPGGHQETLELRGLDGDPKKRLPQDAERELGPGETMRTFVCTNPEERAAEELAGYRGPLLYRVLLRRGLVAVNGRDRSATAVVGVAFTGAEVRPADSGAGGGPRP